MIMNIQCGRGILKTTIINNIRRRNLRLRAASSNPHASVALADHEPELGSSEHASVFTACGRDQIAVCWHPPKPFPYEHTKPIETTEDELRQYESPLRADLRARYKASMTVTGAPWVELQNMFATHKLAFQGRDHRKRRIDEKCEPPPIDRKGL